MDIAGNTARGGATTRGPGTRVRKSQTVTDIPKHHVVIGIATIHNSDNKDDGNSLYPRADFRLTSYCGCFCCRGSNIVSAATATRSVASVSRSTALAIPVSLGMIRGTVMVSIFSFGLVTVEILTQRDSHRMEACS